jgi:hypothetical protein
VTCDPAMFCDGCGEPMPEVEFDDPDDDDDYHVADCVCGGMWVEMEPADAHALQQGALYFYHHPLRDDA